jgi:hypothetical protein
MNHTEKIELSALSLEAVFFIWGYLITKFPADLQASQFGVITLTVSVAAGTITGFVTALTFIWT